MSRIDDAWKRAGGQSVASERLGLPIERASDVDASVVPVLDRYLVERSSPSDPGRSGTRVPAERRHESPAVPATLHGKLVVAPETEPLSIEQYRRLAASLEELQGQRSLTSIMVSSALPRDGKTLTATNIALTLSETYRRRVLLIDADFHRPAVHEMFGLSNEVGLADALRSRDEGLPLVQVSSTLAVLPTGRMKGDPLAALSAERLRILLTQAATRFDWIFVDTPPLGLVTDAQVVSRVTDGVLFVIGAGVTPYKLVQQTLADIGIDRVVGTVLNRVEDHTIPVRDYYRSHYGLRK